MFIIKIKTKWETMGSNLKLEATCQLISSITTVAF